ncbi:MAG: TRAP transporter small permease [Betaproteobacteria bacterium]|nr:TRAP transporter small permease [Betaproteobacteria bacterium]NDE53615.1 TRAP transporter small permease [Actinomycetota bacterium]
MRRAVAFVADCFEEIVAAAAVAVIIASVGWGVITRYVTEQPAAWASEIATLGFAWVVFFGSAACFKYRMHPAIDVVVDRLPAGAQRVVRALNHCLLLCFFFFMAWFGTRFAIDAWESPSPVLRMPQTWLYGPVALCSALMAVRYLQVLAGRVWQIDATRETNAG